MQFGVPKILLLLAGIVLVVGIRRLALPSAGNHIGTRRALFLWALLFTAGVSVWLLAASHRL